MRKGTWLIVVAFLLGLLFCDVLDPADPAVSQATKTTQPSRGEMTILGSASRLAP